VKALRKNLNSICEDDKQELALAEILRLAKEKFKLYSCRYRAVDDFSNTANTKAVYV
jgi:hypothetical protein